MHIDLNNTDRYLGKTSLDPDQMSRLGEVYRRVLESFMDDVEELSFKSIETQKGQMCDEIMEMETRFENENYCVNILHSEAGKKFFLEMTLGKLVELEQWERLLEDEDLRKLFIRELLDFRNPIELQSEIEEEREKEAA